MTHGLEDNCSGQLNNNRASIQLNKKDHLSIGIILDFPAFLKGPKKEYLYFYLQKIRSTSLSSEKKEEDVRLATMEGDAL